MSGENIPVSVIIPNWNGLRYLGPCLEALRRQSRKDFRSIVVDNGSADESRSFLEQNYPEVFVLSLGRNHGFGEAVNRGIALTRTPVVALLNNDTEVEERWVESGLEALERHPDIGYIACQILDYSNRDRLDSAGDYMTRTGLPLKRGMDEPASRYQQPCEVPAASAGAVFIRRKALEQVGPFDADYFLYLEDVDWCLRATAQGIRCLYWPAARVYHVEGGSDPDRTITLEREETRRSALHTHVRTYWIARNRIRLLAKNYPTRLLVRDSIWLAAGFLRSAAFHALKSRLLLPFLKGLLRGIGEIPACLPLRSAIQKARIVSPEEFARRVIASC